MFAMNARRLLPFLALPLLLGGMVSCGQEDAGTPVELRFGSLIGNQAEDPIDNTSQLRFIKKSKLRTLIADKTNFLLLLHGSSDTCSCYTTWHNEILAPYAKRHKLLIYAITLSEFESDADYYGLKRVSGYDTLAVFRDGEAVYQKCTDNETDPFVTTYAGFAEWMGKRVKDPKIFYVDEEILDSYYEGNTSFTIYYGRDTCGDCGYLNRTALAAYLDTHDHTDADFLYIDFDAYRPSRGDDDYEERMAIYNEMKAKYGLAWSEDNPAGYGGGAFPTVYYVNPDGVSYTGDVIEASGVFYNETIDEEGVIHDAYFTKARYEEAKDTYFTYLADSNLSKKWIDEDNFASAEDKSRAKWHDLLAPLEEPIFNTLLAYCVGGK